MSFVISSERGNAEVKKNENRDLREKINLNKEMMKMGDKTKKLLEKWQK